MLQIKHMARDRKKNKGQKAKGTDGVRISGSANEEREMHGHEGEKGTEKEEENA